MLDFNFILTFGMRRIRNKLVMRMFRSLLSVVAIVGFVSSSFVAAQPVRAQVFSENTEIPFANGVSLIVESGSSAVMTGTLTSVSFIIPAGGFVSLKYPGPNAGLLLNNVGEPSCRNFAGSNVLTLNGPLSATIVPDSGTFCTQGGVQVTSSGGLTTSLQAPQGGSYNAGAPVGVVWSTSTSLGVDRIRVRLTTDGGTSFVTVADNEVNDGAATFIAPTITGTNEARLRIEVLAFDGTVLSYVDAAIPFTLVGPEPVVVTPPVVEPTPTPVVSGVPTGTASGVSGAFVPAQVTAGTATIDIDKHLSAVPGAVVGCTAGALIRASLPAVYYCGADGKRYVFPNEKTFKTWYSDFSGVQRITDAELAAIPLGGNATYKPGVRMIKVQSDPRVYVVAHGGVLRNIPSEAAAVTLYGAAWATMVDDIPDGFFVNYSLGTPL